MKHEINESELIVLLADAYEQGYEQCAQDGAADYPQRNEDKDNYVNAKIISMAKQTVESHTQQDLAERQSPRRIQSQPMPHRELYNAYAFNKKDEIIFSQNRLYKWEVDEWLKYYIQVQNVTHVHAYTQNSDPHKK